MFSNIFQTGHLLFLLFAALAAFLGGLIVGLIKGEGGTALLRGLEGLLLAAVGCLLSQLFVAGALATGHGKDSWAVALGLGFFLVPGLMTSCLAKTQRRRNFDPACWKTTIFCTSLPMQY